MVCFLGNQAMNWNLILIVGGVMAAVFLLKRRSFASAAAVRQHLRSGALVIDGRSPGEFNSGHLLSALNMPLDEIETVRPRRVEDKTRVLLLPCRSGRRSGMARRKVRGMDYVNAFNLGSYGRAESTLKRSG